MYPPQPPHASALSHWSLQPSWLVTTRSFRATLFCRSNRHNPCGRQDVYPRLSRRHCPPRQTSLSHPPIHPSTVQNIPPAIACWANECLGKGPPNAAPPQNPVRSIAYLTRDVPASTQIRHRFATPVAVARPGTNPRHGFLGWDALHVHHKTKRRIHDFVASQSGRLHVRPSHAVHFGPNLVNQSPHQTVRGAFARFSPSCGTDLALRSMHSDQNNAAQQYLDPFPAKTKNA